MSVRAAGTGRSTGAASRGGRLQQLCPHMALSRQLWAHGGIVGPTMMMTMAMSEVGEVLMLVEGKGKGEDPMDDTT